VKTDAEVHTMNRERHKGKTQAQAAAKASMHVNTARKYERAGQLPSQLRQPRTYRTRTNPFAADWAWVEDHLRRDSALQAHTLFALLATQHPGRYRPGQLRTLQRQIAQWRAEHGPDREVFFPQVHRPGVRAESDFTHMTDLAITLDQQPFPHLLYHVVLTYSNVEAVQICFSETFESLAAGIEYGLWQFGGVPTSHRTDNLSAAVYHMTPTGRSGFTERYSGLMAHYGMQPTTNTAGEAHENGDVEQAHHRFKQAVDQALRVRGSRDFPDRTSYAAWLRELVRQRNLTRQTRWVEEQAVLRPLPVQPLDPCQELRVKVNRFSLIRVLRNTYSVPSRLIGQTLTIRVRAEHLEGYLGCRVVVRLPRLRGQRQHQIDYHHLIGTLVRKPGAFAQYQYREELFPSLVFRQSYDTLARTNASSADREYVRVLHLAATTSESEVETALRLLLDAGQVPSVSAVRALVRPPHQPLAPSLSTPELDMQQYDQLLAVEVQA
jgi:hypothetical protein